ncbi:MAG: 3-deoxy-manno-octulosonate cytidylyltransferase [Candidatus Omnitrophica bacterium]|nr:3-deoxy-manno-octulosonate cytidylyltransferase [Candidatus Omnitrophota bacterium]
MKEKIICIIPARYDSERLPGKVLYEINGKTILQRVYERAKLCKKYFSDIIVATDDERIEIECKKFGAKSIITSRYCKSGSDRVAEVVKNIDCDIVVNLQCDEPFIPKEAIEKPIIEILKNKNDYVVTSLTKIRKKEEIYDENVVKTVIDKNKYALYFSRSLIPYPRIYFSDKNLSKNKKVVFYKHIGIYVFRKNFLLKFSSLPCSFLEKIEKLEQLRIIENGYKIKVVIVKSDSPSVDTLEDIKKILKI